MERKSLWPTAGEQHQDLSEDSVFVTPEIRSFLNNDHVFILIASKGMGKTLLLRYKKDLILKDGRPGILVIPQNSTMNYITLPLSVPAGIKANLSDYKYWESLWIASVIISILTNVSFSSLHEWEREELSSIILGMEIESDWKNGIIGNIKNNKQSKIDPSAVLYSFLSSGKGFKFSKFWNKHSDDLKRCYTKYIRNGVFVFIDSVDQELQGKFPDDKNIWSSGQKGLMTACYQINRHNPHIKIYTAIRHEAYSDFSGDLAMSMNSSVLVLKYNYNQLRDIFLKSIKKYEGLDSIEEFLGQERISNSRINGLTEDPFRYIYRHTIYTPRCLMVIGGDISKRRTIDGNGKRPHTTNNEIVQLVNEMGNKEVYNDYLVGEMKYFLTELNKEEYILNLLSIVNKNILTYSNLKAISALYHARFVGDRKEKKQTHPFCDLFNIGLIGVVAFDPMQQKKVQKFKKPFEFNWNMMHIIPRTTLDYFIIHPSLNYKISEVNPDYVIHPDILIGNGCEWKNEYNDTLEKNKVRVFVSYSAKNSQVVERIANSVKTQMNLKNFYYDDFLDKWNLNGGEYFQPIIENEVDNSDILLLMISQDSIDSFMVTKEWRQKYNQEILTGNIMVIGVLIDDTSVDRIPPELKDKQFIKINLLDSDMYDLSIEKITKSIEKAKRLSI